ncbi:HWE histidine kinase domain-containing protein [Pseudomonas syringae]|uniref:HWE histidine kinase domain-containing protein n=1 Tax=Pseudomonas syringae TaxID=317 RepID=UPI0013730795|nr:HWE histidine kinase domain-containing protein [Pseudomonas syringae]NAT23091.1 chemotaxis protein CheR [Pseudomonas syringae pv. actinidifoliorum]NAT37965.1 chemotaxis protein CheR [Pseudomonas syringae pv. actinidifoliorum]
MREFLEVFRNRALDVMSSALPAESLLEDFAIALQARLPGVIVGINVLDKAGRTFRQSIFPNLPSGFSQSLVGNIITGKHGSCGLGILTGKTIEVSDVANDPRFSQEWKALFALHDLHAMISIPALSAENNAQGSIAIIHPLGLSFTAEQRDFLQAASSLCARICAYSRSQESNTLILGELEHRIRNLFLTIGGVANLTLKRYPEAKQFRAVFGERLVMMHRAHSLALSTCEIDMATLLQEMLAPYQKDCDISFSGPDILLTQEAASALALVIHELGTNAAKYGSLAQGAGGLDIQWSIVAQGINEPDATFRLVWTECGGPQVEQPSRKGYGTAMIKGSLSNAFDGAATFFYEPAGLKCEISAPFSRKLGRSR